MNSGVYEIRNLVSGKVYVGSAVDLYMRKAVHLSNLRNNKNLPNKYLQNAWNKYGEENFEFNILFLCACQDVTATEQRFLDIKQPFPWMRKGYNLNPMAANSLGHRHTEETKLKIGKISGIKNKGENNPFFGKHHSEESRQKIKEAKKGIKVHTFESRQRMSKRRKGNQCSIKPYPAFQHQRTREIIPAGKNMASLCRRHGLDPTNMSRVTRGKQKYHKGWELCEI